MTPSIRQVINAILRLSETIAGQPEKVNKGGLLVTDELEKAITRCRNDVRRIAQECRRSGRRFRDSEFDIEGDRERCLHGLIPPKDGEGFDPKDVMRASALFEDPQFFVDGATASDLSQGKLGDCWFISALTVIATAGLVEKMCVERDEKLGIYGFIFWRDAGWVHVIIDDLLFISLPNWDSLTTEERLSHKNNHDLYERTARRGSEVLYFSKSRTPNETWVPLLEKAYAKLHGDYASLDGGFVGEGVEDLTGAVSTDMHVQDIFDADAFWTSELSLAGSSRLFGCDIKHRPSHNRDATNFSLHNGLKSAHAYSVVKAVEFGGMRFLKVRNPWGEDEWKGRWSDGSKEWTGVWLDALKVLNHRFGDDGEFIMEYGEFLKTWDHIQRCRLFNEDWAFSQLWLKVDVGDHPKPLNYGDVSFTISVSKRTDAVLMLSQLDTRYFIGLESHNRFSLDFAIYKSGSSTRLASTTFVHNSLFRRSVNLEIELEEGDYVVHVRVDRTLRGEEEIERMEKKSRDTKKWAAKNEERLKSESIAANFNFAKHGASMPLPPDLYTGTDLTTMEIQRHKWNNKYKQMKLQAFGVPGSMATKKPGEECQITEAAPYMRENVDEVDPGAATDGKQKVGIYTEEAGTGKPLECASVTDVEASSEIYELHQFASLELEQPGSGDIWKDLPASLSSPTPVHETFTCDGCGITPIVGSRFHCMSASCPDCNYCAKCFSVKAHHPEHRFIEITDPYDAEKLKEGNQDPEQMNSIVLGLRVYAHKDSKVVIGGQLRHGHVVRHHWNTTKQLQHFSVP